MKKKCKHKLDWDKVWLPARLYIKPHGFFPKGSRVMPLTKYWHGICLNCKKEITEEDIAYEDRKKKES